MKKQDKGNVDMVQGQKPEKLYAVGYAQVRRHSRVLYLPLDPLTVRLNKIKKFDVVKFALLELRRAPEGDEKE
jgi:hypothetical protein